MRMKALKTFRGQVGENDDTGSVRTGTEFEAAHDKRVRELEIRGLAILVTRLPKPTEPRAATIRNAAADTGPLDRSPGGGTGAETAPSSSPAARAPRTVNSAEPKAKPTSSRSTKAGASARGLTRSMPATRRGGASKAALQPSKG
jgi:hypothetical protein